MMIKKDLKTNRQTIGIIVRAVVFTMILFALFLFFTYLFRNTHAYSRQNIVEYYEEQENTLDVVFIGTSNVANYWDPLRVWNQYGFTSRNYTATGGQVHCFLPAIKDALKTQKPKVLVVEARSFVNSGGGNDVAPQGRKFLDSLDFGLDRFNAIRYYCDVRNISFKDAIPLYIDLIYYHNNYEAFVTKENWELADNRVREKDGSLFKGHIASAEHMFFEDPSSNLTLERKELSDIMYRLYMDIITYCKDNDINLVFLSTPYRIKEQACMKLNTLEDIAKEHGIPFLNCNWHYEEIGIDFARDMKDRNHVNLLGSRKFTDFYAKYLTEHFDLPDHRNESDAVYANWNAAYEKYAHSVERKEKQLLELLEKRDRAFAAQSTMIQTQDAYEWFSAAKNDEFSLIMLANKPFEHMPSADSLIVLEAFGYEKEYLSEDRPALIIYRNGVNYSSNSEPEYNGFLPETEMSCRIVSGSNPQISVDGADCLENYPDGLCIAAVNNHTGLIFDRISVFVGEDGTLSMQRL